MSGGEVKSKPLGDGSVNAGEGGQGRAGKGKEKDRPLLKKFEHPQLKFLVAPLLVSRTIND